MKPLPIEPSDEHVSPGDLHGHMYKGRFLLPRDIALALARDGVRTASDLMSYVQSFPSAIASLLHWSSQDVGRAVDRLRSELAGKIPDQYMHPESRRNPPLGARDPTDLP